jgi:hypothetical protein
MRLRRQHTKDQKCHACSAMATTRCRSCGTLSCAEHLQSIYLSHGRGGAYELRCQSCYSSAQSWKVVGLVAVAAFIVIFFYFFMML